MKPPQEMRILAALYLGSSDFLGRDALFTWVRRHIFRDSGPQQHLSGNNRYLVILQNMAVHNFKITYGETTQPYS